MNASLHTSQSLCRCKGRTVSPIHSGAFDAAYRRMLVRERVRLGLWGLGAVLVMVLSAALPLWYLLRQSL